MFPALYIMKFFVEFTCVYPLYITYANTFTPTRVNSCIWYSSFPGWYKFFTFLVASLIGFLLFSPKRSTPFSARGFHFSTTWTTSWFKSTFPSLQDLGLRSVKGCCCSLIISYQFLRLRGQFLKHRTKECPTAYRLFYQ